MRIPLFRPTIYPEAIEAVKEVLNSGWLGIGPKTQAFEKAFAAYVGAPHCVGLTRAPLRFIWACTCLTFRRDRR